MAEAPVHADDPQLPLVGLLKVFLGTTIGMKDIVGVGSTIPEKNGTHKEDHHD